MEREATRILKELENELAASNFPTCVGILEELGRIEMTVALLKRTRAGVRCTALKSHEHAPLAAAARDCVRKWKEMTEHVLTAHAAGVDGASASAGGGVSSAARGVGGASAAVASGGGGASASASASAEAPLPAPVDARSRSVSPRRQAVLGMLSRALADAVSAFVSAPAGGEAIQRWGQELPTPERVAAGAAETSARLEAVLFEQLGGGLAAAPAPPYSDKFRCLLSNLKSNHQLAAEVFFGRVAVLQLTQMTSDELASEEARRKAQEIIARDKESTMLDWDARNRKALLASAGVKGGQGIPCPKCKGRDTNWIEKQTLPGDEPMTRCVCFGAGGRVYKGAERSPPHHHHHPSISFFLSSLSHTHTRAQLQVWRVL
jgi:DNA-directed RNA polymerase subunit M/transcription elongation factor TFIIS